VAIIGGGLSGLAAAHILNAAMPSGYLDGVTLVETAPRLGGKIVTERSGGFVIEGGPDSFLTSKPHALHLCRGLGLTDQLIGTLAPRQVFVLSRGVLQLLPEGMAALVPTRILPFLRSGLFSWREKARMAREILVRPHRDGADESVGEFVRRRLGPAAVDRLAAPLLAGIYAGDVDQMSLQATFPQFAQMEAQHGSLMGATLRSRLARRRRNSALRSDGQGVDGLGVFATLREGLDRLVSRLGNALPRVAVRLGVSVRAIGRDGRRYRVHLSDESSLAADVVIITTPAYEAARLLRGFHSDAASALEQIPYVSTTAITLGFRRGQVAHPLSGHGYVVARGERQVHTACTWTSSKWPARAPADHVLLRCFVGRVGDPPEPDDDRLVGTVLAELEPLLRITGRPVLGRVHRWEDAMPQYEVGHLDRLEAIADALSQTPGILVAGAGYGGVGIPDCVRQGMEAAESALALLRPASVELAPPPQTSRPPRR
jgi:oxygen-dependent protoporphyrinogen oxidase